MDEGVNYDNALKFISDFRNYLLSDLNQKYNEGNKLAAQSALNDCKKFNHISKGRFYSKKFEENFKDLEKKVDELPEILSFNDFSLKSHEIKSQSFNGNS